VVIFQIKPGNPRELTELVGDGTSETVAAQIQKGESDQHGHVCRDGTNEVVAAEIKPGEVLERDGVEGVKLAVDPCSGKAERSNVAGPVARDAEPGAG
jgi:hypothetical protein